VPLIELFMAGVAVEPPGCPFDAESLPISDCIIGAVTPDLFWEEATNADMAFARSLVPAFAGILAPPIPIPPIMTEPLPVMPFMTPSDASFVKAVIMAEDVLMPRVFAYCDMAASDMP
jgi:hypothetical protein